MKWLARRVIAGLWLAAALPIHQPAADDTPSRALLALFETNRISLPQGPLPSGLRFVLYEDGQVIVRSPPTQADPDPPGRGVTYGVLDRGAAEALRRDAATELKEVGAKDSGGIADIGLTILEVWDGDRYRRFTANGPVCQAEGRDFTAGIWKRIWEQADPHFVKVCDRLLQYRIASPQPWTPKGVELRIGAMDDTPERQVEWPKDWPPAPADLKPKAAVAFCAPVSAKPGDFSNTLITARWGAIGRTALVIDASTAAVIWDWYFDLPAPVPMVNEKGEPDGAVGNTCPQAARP
jgi:hypothetical protein